MRGRRAQGKRPQGLVPILPVGLTFPLQGRNKRRRLLSPLVGALTVFTQPETRRAKQEGKH